MSAKSVEVDARGSGVQGLLCLHIEFKSSLGYVRPYLKTIRKAYQGWLGV